MSEERLRAVEIDAASLPAAGREQEDERQVAIADLVEENVFRPVEASSGPYVLKLSMAEGRLVFDLSGEGLSRRHILSMSPLRGVMKDYFLVCESHANASRTATPAQMEAFDMGRRAVHDEASRILQERLTGKVETDHATARRLFTLLCALQRRG